MAQVQPEAVDSTVAAASTMTASYQGGEAYSVTVRGHGFLVDQPVEAGGEDSAPTPTELFVASLATCVAYYAGRYLTRHGYAREGLGVSVSYRMAYDLPVRVADIRLTLRVPKALPIDRWRALHAVVSHCTVHNSINKPPAINVELVEA